MVPIILVILRILLMLFSGAAVGATAVSQSPGFCAPLCRSSVGLNTLFYGGIAAGVVAIYLHLPQSVVGSGDLKSRVVAGLKCVLAPVKFVISCVKEALV